MSFESTGTELSSTTRKDAVPSTPMATVTVGQSLTTTRPPSQDFSTPAATERHMDTNFPRSNRDQGEDSSKPTADLLPTANSETNQVRTDFSAQSYESPPENPAREQTGGTTPQAFRGTLSQFDTSLVSPEQAFGSPQDVENNTPGLAGFGQNATLPTGMPLNEQNVDDGEDECFDDIFQKIMDTHIRFGDDFQLYEDQMLYLTENLCLQHGEMLVFEDENLDLINELDEFQAELEQMIIEATG